MPHNLMHDTRIYLSGAVSYHGKFLAVCRIMGGRLWGVLSAQHGGARSRRQTVALPAPASFRRLQYGVFGHRYRLPGHFCVHVEHSFHIFMRTVGRLRRVLGLLPPAAGTTKAALLALCAVLGSGIGRPFCGTDQRTVCCRLCGAQPDRDVDRVRHPCALLPPRRVCGVSGAPQARI